MGGRGGWRAKRKGCTREADWNVPRGAQKEEKKGKEKRANESAAMIADVSHRCATGGFTSL